MPLLWAMSLGTAIPKYNQKTGIKSLRLLHLLDPLSKAWISSIWRKFSYHLGPTAFGCVPGRCRIEAAITIRVLQYRLAAAGLITLMLLFDVSNAFPSIAWTALEKRFSREFQVNDQRILQLRHQRAICAIVDYLDRIGVFRLGSGNRQGDGPAAQQFALAFQKIVQNWSRRTHNVLDANFFVAKSPWTQTQVFLNSFLFADDLLRIAVVPNDAQPVAICQSLISTLQQFLDPASLALNSDKLLLLLSSAGPASAHAFEHHFNALASSQFQQALGHKAKHLGFVYPSHCLDADCGAKVEVTSRICAANKAWRNFRQLWAQQAVPLPKRTMFYCALVFSVLLAGLESLVLSSSQLKRLEVWHTSKLRYLLFGLARGQTNIQVRTSCRIASVEAALLKRRIHFWQRLAAKPAEHTAVIAALSGQINSLLDQLTGAVPSSCANPWLKQAWKDLQFVASLDPAFQQELSQKGWQQLYLCSSFLRFSAKRVPCFSSSCDPSVRRIPDIACNICGQQFRSAPGLATHKRRIHHVMHASFAFVISNQCPRCRRCFSGARQARKHLVRYFPNACRGNLVTHFPVLVPRHLHCVACPQLVFRCFEDLQQHCNHHLSRLADQSE